MCDKHALVWAPDSASVHRLIGFARGLTTSDSVFYIGQLGAQRLGPVARAGPCAGVREPGDHHGVEDRHR